VCAAWEALCWWREDWWDICGNERGFGDQLAFGVELELGELEARCSGGGRARSCYGAPVGRSAFAHDGWELSPQTPSFTLKLRHKQ
jgi:hypothetical protein